MKKDGRLGYITKGVDSSHDDLREDNLMLFGATSVVNILMGCRLRLRVLVIHPDIQE